VRPIRRRTEKSAAAATHPNERFRNTLRCALAIRILMFTLQPQTDFGCDDSSQHESSLRSSYTKVCGTWRPRSGQRENNRTIEQNNRCSRSFDCLYVYD
jgi:hypothetical protein